MVKVNRVNSSQPLRLFNSRGQFDIEKFKYKFENMNGEGVRPVPD